MLLIAGACKHLDANEEVNLLNLLRAAIAGNPGSNSARQVRLDILQLMLQGAIGGVGNGYDKALAERIFHSLKAEAIRGERFNARVEKRPPVFESIEVDYNRTGRHSANGCISPAALEAKEVA